MDYIDVDIPACMNGMMFGMYSRSGWVNLTPSMKRFEIFVEELISSKKRLDLDGPMKLGIRAQFFDLSNTMSNHINLFLLNKRCREVRVFRENQLFVGRIEDKEISFTTDGGGIFGKIERLVEMNSVIYARRVSSIFVPTFIKELNIKLFWHLVGQMRSAQEGMAHAYKKITAGEFRDDAGNPFMFEIQGMICVDTEIHEIAKEFIERGILRDQEMLFANTYAAAMDEAERLGEVSRRVPSPRRRW